MFFAQKYAYFAIFSKGKLKRRQLILFLVKKTYRKWRRRFGMKCGTFFIAKIHSLFHLQYTRRLYCVLTYGNENIMEAVLIRWSPCSLLVDNRRPSRTVCFNNIYSEINLFSRRLIIRVQWFDLVFRKWIVPWPSERDSTLNDTFWRWFLSQCLFRCFWPQILQNVPTTV
jgi:hypothetical protein